MNITPMVIDRTGKNHRAWDLYSRLLEDRVIFLSGPIGRDEATSIVAQLLFLQYSNSEKDISMYIGSPGGSITAGMAIYDTMQYIKPDISTICVGDASSMAAVLMAAGAPGKRFALPNARMMIHQPLSGFSGQATDIEIQSKEINRMKTRLSEILAFHTGQTIEQVAKDSDRDFYMDAEAAKKYGLIDDIMDKI